LMFVLNSGHFWREIVETWRGELTVIDKRLKSTLN